MAILKIAKEGQKILREKALPIKAIDRPVIKLAADMMETMNKSNGLGLAAPQVSKSLRLICVKTKEGDLAFINPIIRGKSFRKNIGEEGCLSVPGFFGFVKRYNSVVIEAESLEKEKVKFKAKGLMARVIQHEIDHLNGILFTDKIERRGSGKKDERQI